MPEITQAQKDRMMIKAIQRDGLGITPTVGRKFSECYVYESVIEMVVFHYNDSNHSTRAIGEPPD